MAWSTRELAELAGTTLNAVRHYHRVGLLPQPDRAGNGYKQYEVRHLARLILIRRLRDLGLSLEQIEGATCSGGSMIAALDAIDSEFDASIVRLQRIRGEIGAIVRGSAGPAPRGMRVADEVDEGQAGARSGTATPPSRRRETCAL